MEIPALLRVIAGKRGFLDGKGRCASKPPRVVPPPHWTNADHSLRLRLTAVPDECT